MKKNNKDNDLKNTFKNNINQINNFNNIIGKNTYKSENNSNIYKKGRTYNNFNSKSPIYIYNYQTPIMSNNNLLLNEYFHKIKSPDSNKRNIQFESSKNKYILNNNLPYSNRNFKAYEFCNQYNVGNYNDKLNPNIYRNNEQKDEERKQIIELNDEITI